MVRVTKPLCFSKISIIGDVNDDYFGLKLFTGVGNAKCADAARVVAVHVEAGISPIIAVAFVSLL